MNDVSLPIKYLEKNFGLLSNGIVVVGYDQRIKNHMERFLDLLETRTQRK